MLIYNADFAGDSDLVSMTDAHWDTAVAVHLRGAYECTRAAWPRFRRQSLGRDHPYYVRLELGRGSLVGTRSWYVQTLHRYPSNPVGILVRTSGTTGPSEPHRNCGS